MSSPNWTYSGDPGKNTKDAVRFLIGDTEERDPILKDAEIRWILTEYSNSPIQSAIRCCEVIAAKFSRRCDETVGSVSLKLSQKATQYMKLRDDLRNRLAIEVAIPYAGGISQSDKESVAANSDRVEPAFRKHSMENEQIAPWVSRGEGDLDDQDV